MAKQIARLLKTNMMADIDMPALAQFLQSQGRKGDSILAHINPKEAMLLQKMGGAGTENPATGLPEFYSYGYSPSEYASEFDLYGNQMSGGDFDDARIQARERRPNSRMMEDRSVEINESPILEFNPSTQNFNVPSQGIPPDTAYFAKNYDDPRQGVFAPNSKTQRSVYERLTGVPTGSLNRPDDLMQSSPIPRVYDAATGNRFTMEDPYSRALSTFTEPQTVNTDYLNAINLAGSGRFAQVSELPQISPEIDTELAATTPELAQEDNRNVLRRGIDYLKEVTGLSGEELSRLGLATGLGIQGAISARRMAEQGQEARREQEAIAAPYRERGAALLAQAEGGQLTPQAQQSLQAMRARLQQGAESRGGVGAQQAAAQVEAFRQQLLANQFDYGMKISNIGDQIAMGAIRTGLEADRYASQMTSSYFNNMARLLAGMGGEQESPVTQQTQVRGAR